MAVYGGIQAHELGYWLTALTNAAYDPRRPLANVHGGCARARTARQDLLDIAGCYRSNQYSAEEAAAALSRWCLHYLDKAEWYRLTGERRDPSAADSGDASPAPPGRHRAG
ncbi:hypothetical protein P1P91_02520 [Halomonas piscis]|uniref:Uncharacterized protein n=1 Tax=Halomonas piscis TaxID=3031727 RepID=A0ABY9Z0E1_9GAMM|nr:hypothetical protein [Halomonas piscis]WNK20582.1 hypothetical protein P1P91_02520 [Halomonas piscis]